MGNSPSQVVAEGTHGEPDNFNLDAISDGSGGEENEDTIRKNPLTMSNLKSQKETHGASQTSASSKVCEATPFDVPPTSESSAEQRTGDSQQPTSAQVNRESNILASSPEMTLDLLPEPMPPPKKHNPRHEIVEPLDDYDYPPLDSENNAISVASADPTLQVPLMEKAGSAKRKRHSSTGEETPSSRVRKRRKNSSPPTSVDSAGKEVDVHQLRRLSPTNESASGENGLQALQHEEPSTAEQTQSRRRSSSPLPTTADVVEPEAGIAAIEDAESETSQEASPRRQSLATSVAKRTFPFVVKRGRKSKYGVRGDVDDSDSMSEYVANEDEDTDTEASTYAAKRNSALADKIRKTTLQNHGEGNDADPESEFVAREDNGNGVSEEDSAAPWPAFKPRPKASCPVIAPNRSGLKRHLAAPESALKKKSRRVFEVESSEDESLAGHSDSRHSSRHKCSVCAEGFKSLRLLKEHESETQHGDGTGRTGVTGRFSAEEVRKLENYKRSFCRMYDVGGHEFNEMMTDSCRRGAGHPWSYDIISKQEFLSQYFDVLPDRNRKSMARYRERNWQNAAGSKDDWTKEDDDQIVRLVEEIGAKWVEIGQRLTRTQDAVQQRWKKHLQYRDTIQHGAWSTEENDTLKKAVVAAKQRSGLSQKASTDKRIAWSTVSEALHNTRTPKQCADRWQFLREHGLGRERRSSKTKTKPSSKKRKKELSNTYVDDSDSDLQDGNDGDGDEDQGQVHPDMRSKSPGEVEDSAPGEADPRSSRSGVEHAQYSPTTAEEQSENEDFVSATQSRQQSKTRQPLDTITANNYDDDDGNAILESPKLPTFPKQTPSKVTTLSQAFANTQANSTAVRRPLHRLTVPASDRPSPSIPMQLRLQSADIEEIPAVNDDLEDVEEELEDNLEQTISGSAVPRVDDNAQMTLSTIPDSESEDETESESDEDESVFGVRKKPMGPSKSTHLARNGHSADTRRGLGEKAHQEAGLPPLPVIPKEVGSREAKKLPGGEEGTSSESRASDEEESSSDEEMTSDEESESQSESDDSMVEDTHNDFMDSIKQSAKKAELAKQQRSRQSPYIAFADTSSDSDDRSIEHG